MYKHSDGPDGTWSNHAILESYIGKQVWILLEPEPKLYFYADAHPLTLIKPQVVGDDYLSLLVTRSNARKTSIMAGQKIANEMQEQINRACHDQLIMMHGMSGKSIDDHDVWSNHLLPEGCVVVHDAPRYIVDQRLGIVAVLDTHHPEYEPLFPGLHSDLVWVVASWVSQAYGVAKECFVWQVKKAEDLAALLNSTGANQSPDYGLADMCGELQEQRDQLLAALKLLLKTSSPVSAIAYNLGQGHEREEWNSRIYPAIKNLDEAFSEAVKIINKCEGRS